MGNSKVPIMRDGIWINARRKSIELADYSVVYGSAKKYINSPITYRILHIIRSQANGQILNDQR